MMIASTAVIRKEDVVLFLDVDGVLTTRRCVEGDFEDDDESLYFYEDLLHPKQKEEGKNVEQGEEKKFLTPLEKSRVAMLKVLRLSSICFSCTMGSDISRFP